MNELFCCLYLSLQAITLVPHDHPFPSDRQSVSNPYAFVSIGYEKQFRTGPFQLSFTSELFHQSSISTGLDQGDDGFRTGFKVFFHP